ncbi:peptidoglycan-associated lipoprotein Pal [Chlorobium phaeovibrioides]|uniref:Peptidoglycan-associated lipoprotein n=2 Tax=Chlorobium phaeovibrioides TaxID=1094 RepID=A0ABW9UML3_CHLPH|nr:peptidoglycan-associated lipoprotein Pal [Chlorobium phaeovibrioides]MWV53989.1 peptidoglycan-associated lipoprotein Pal [Chlorobium phaeovibrioides]QEQ56774.1 peptidoglycan-associated lipoprotein Pal [Chlorobium phaeovibrioides]RTY37212.1 peptidoglycan-associated lipoprotein Pal [Chlorobium phaeovibrioides]HCD37013.1 peptidoglycan-associated lipoprotein Pal [Chlorobium sp.]
MKHTMKGLLALLLMITAGCSSKSAVAPTDTADTYTPPAAPPAAVVSTPGGYGFDEYQTGPLGDVFYEFDSSELSADAEDQLKQNAAWMGANAAAATLVEGHCDERGTSEYNIALGERRAGNAKEYMVRLGVPAASIETMSYGEEKPFAPGHDESAWSKNRRAHFVLK